MDLLAQGGLRFNNFHTTALCSPTRNALKTGTQPPHRQHRLDHGDARRRSPATPDRTRTASRRWRRCCGSTATAPARSASGTRRPRGKPACPARSTAGRRTRGSTSSTASSAARPTSGIRSSTTALIKVEPPKMENYHFTVDMTNQAINWVKAQQSMTPDKPFMVYYAPGATHAPHHVPKEWADKYKGQFDKGWDEVRNETLERQKKLGVDSGRHAAGRAAEGSGRVGLAARRSAAPVRAPGRSVRRLPGAHRRRDRAVPAGAGGHRRARQHRVHLHRRRQRHQRRGRLRRHVQRDDLLQRRRREGRGSRSRSIDKWGGPETFPHMAAGWAVAFDTPFSWTKQVASDFGGTRNGMVIHWPQGIKEQGGLRSQFSHVIDIAPTILEAAGLPEPKSVNGTVQTPIEGTSLRLRLQRRRGAGAAHDAVLRDVRQPRDLQRAAGSRGPSIARRGRRPTCRR